MKLSKDIIIIPFSVPGRMGRELLLDRIEKVLEQNQ
jgi:hypothetical protein